MSIFGFSGPGGSGAAATAADGRAAAGRLSSTGCDGASAAGVSARSSSSKSELEIVCGLSSSVTTKSSCVSPRTDAPLLSRTTMFTSTSSVAARNTGRCGEPLCARGDTGIVVSAVTIAAGVAERARRGYRKRRSIEEQRRRRIGELNRLAVVVGAQRAVGPARDVARVAEDARRERGAGGELHAAVQHPVAENRRAGAV